MADHCESLLNIALVNFTYAAVWGVFTAYWFTNTWYINHRFTKPLQKTIFFVLFFKTLSDGFAGLLFTACPYANSARMYWNLAVNTCYTMYSTLLYTTFLLIAKGFCVNRNYLEKPEVSTLVTLLVIVYLGFSAYMLEPVVLGILALMLVVFLGFLTIIYASETMRKLEVQVESFRSHGIMQMVAPTAIKWRLIHRFYRLTIAYFAVRTLHLMGNEIVLRGFNSYYYDWFLWSDALVGLSEAILLITIFLLLRSKDLGRYSSLDWAGDLHFQIAPMLQARVPHSLCELLPKSAVIVVMAREKGRARLAGIEIAFPEE